MPTDPTPFNIKNLLAAMPFDIGVGKVVAGSWRVADAFFGRDNAIQLRLEDPEGRHLDVLVMPRNESRRAFRRMDNLDMLYLSQPGGPDLYQEARDAIEKLATAVKVADSAIGAWEFPEAPPGEEPDARPESRATVLTLSLDGPCGARCTFCAHIVNNPPRTDFDEGYHREQIEALETGRRQQILELNLTGTEPLAYPRVVELVGHAVDIGYDRVSVVTTGVPLADHTFAERLADALPEKRSFSIPLYGDDAETHDAITRYPGSFDKVIEGLDNLTVLGCTRQVKLCSIALKQNIRIMDRVADLAACFGPYFRVQMPFPNVGGRFDPYAEITPRITEAVAVLHGFTPPVVLREAPPCVALRHEEETGVPSFSELVQEQGQLVGRGDVDESVATGAESDLRFCPPVVRCPHADRCSLADRCTKHVYRAYAELYGLEEFVPPGQGVSARSSPRRVVSLRDDCPADREV